MSYCLGVDIGNETTSWTRTERTRDTITVTATGEFPSTVGLDPTGTLTTATPDTELEHLTTNFVNALGQSEPIIVGHTPYGIEALIACLINTATATTAPPDAVVLVHADNLDDYRLSLLDEAAKIAGLPGEHTTLMSRTDARTHTPDTSAATSAATAAWTNIPTTHTTNTATAAAAGAATATGLTAAALHLSTNTPTASAATGAGPAGTPLTPTTGPTGTPLTPTGPTGPTGDPIPATTGPAGDPITPTTGPTGTPLDTPTSSTTAPSSTTATPAARIRPKWLPAAVAGGVVAVVAVAVVAVVAVVVATGNDDTPPETVATATTLDTDTDSGDAATPAGEPTPTTPATATPDTTIETLTGPAAFDTSAVIGNWESECDPFIALDGASTGRYEFSDTGPNEITMVASGVDYQTPDCSDAGSVEIVFESVFVVVGETALNGVPAVQFDGSEGPGLLAADGDQMVLASGTDAASAADIIELTRR